MKITLSGALIALLIWDYSVSSPGQSLTERFYRAAASSDVFGPVIASTQAGIGDLRPLLANAVRQIGDDLISVADAQSLNGTSPSVQVVAQSQPAQKKR